MSGPTNRAPTGDAAALLVAWAEAALGRFVRETYETRPDFCAAFAKSKALAAALGASGSTTYEKLAARAAAELAAHPGAAALAQPGEPTGGRLLLLGLALAPEADRAFAEACAELQRPGGGRRPTLDLTARILRAAGVDVPALDGLGSDPFFGRGVLALLGDGPAPTREVAGYASTLTGLRGGGVARTELEPLPPPPQEAPAEEAARAADALAAGRVATIVLRGSDAAGRAEAAAWIAMRVGCSAARVPPETWANAPELRAACAAGRVAPLIEPRLGPGDVLGAAGLRTGEGVPVFVSLGRDGAVDADAFETVLGPAPRARRLAAWSAAFGAGAAARAASRVAASARLPAAALAAAVRDAEAHLRAQVARPRRNAAERTRELLLALAATRARSAPDALRLVAEPVVRRDAEDAFVPPAGAVVGLADLVARCVARDEVFDGLGPAAYASAGPGVKALFHGPSGTGKSLAASWLAARLGAPLYRIDLAAAMNKYVGETEKNLGRALDLAAAADVVLLFDEADGLFGRRTDARESGERYANLLTNYLLTRLEEHPGIVVLTTNAKNRVDEAFLRRFDAVLEFPAPGPAERAELWRRHLGKRAPDDAFCERLGRAADLTGGYVRAAAIAAATAEPGRRPLTPRALTRAVAEVYRRLGRRPPQEFDGGIAGA